MATEEDPQSAAVHSDGSRGLGIWGKYPVEFGPGHHVRPAVLIYQKALELVNAAVIAERSRGASWDEIARHMDTGKSSVYSRFQGMSKSWQDDLPDNANPAEVAAAELEDGWAQLRLMVAAQEEAYRSSARSSRLISLAQYLKEGTTASAADSGSSDDGLQEIPDDSCQICLSPTGPSAPPEDPDNPCLFCSDQRPSVQSTKRSARRQQPLALSAEGRLAAMEVRLEARLDALEGELRETQKELARHRREHQDRAKGSPVPD